MHVAMAMTMFETVFTTGRLDEPTAIALRQRIWFDACSHLPASLFKAACDRYLRTSEFFPKPVQIIDLCRDPLNDLRRRAYPDHGVWRAESDDDLPPPSPESVAKIAAMVAEFVSRGKAELYPLMEMAPASQSIEVTDTLRNSCAVRRAKGLATCERACQRQRCDLRDAVWAP